MGSCFLSWAALNLLIDESKRFDFWDFRVLCRIRWAHRRLIFADHRRVGPPTLWSWMLASVIRRRYLPRKPAAPPKRVPSLRPSASRALTVLAAPKASPPSLERQTGEENMLLYIDRVGFRRVLKIGWRICQWKLGFWNNRLAGNLY